MFPIRDHNPSSRTPWVTWGLIAVNIVVFALYVPLLEDQRALAALFSTWGLVPGRVASGGSPLPLVTSMFLHGGFLHLVGNMLFLWIFGDNLEDMMGKMGFLFFYLASGIGAAALHIAQAPWSAVPMVGASGAIAGVMGGYLLLFPRARVDMLLFLVIYFRVFTVPAWAMLGVWFAIQLFGAAGADPNAGGVAYLAHAGGFVVGLVLTVPVWLRRGGPAFWRATHGLPPHPEAEYTTNSPYGIPKLARGERRSPIPRVGRQRGDD